MGTFLAGAIFAAVLYGANSAMKENMKKVYQNNPEELARLKVFGYPVYSWVKFTYFRKDEPE